MTTAKLCGARRIRLSTSTKTTIRGGHPYQQLHLSGLCIEYWDSNYPVYVGEWDREVQDCVLEFDGPDDRLVACDVFQERSVARRPYPRVEETRPLSSLIGHVLGIRFSTAKRRSTELLVDADDANPDLSWTNYAVGHDEFVSELASSPHFGIAGVTSRC